MLSNPSKRLILFPLALLLVWAGWTLYTRLRFPPLPLGETTLASESGEPVDPAAVQTPFVLVSYFQSWCGDCIRESPSIQALQDENPGKVTVLMISDEPWEKIRPFQKKAAVNLPFYQSSQSLRKLGIYSYPTTYLLGPDRKVLLGKQEGYDWNSPEVRHLIAGGK